MLLFGACWAAWATLQTTAAHELIVTKQSQTANLVGTTVAETAMAGSRRTVVLMVDSELDPDQMPNDCLTRFDANKCETRVRFWNPTPSETWATVDGFTDLQTNPNINRAVQVRTGVPLQLTVTLDGGAVEAGTHSVELEIRHVF